MVVTLRRLLVNARTGGPARAAGVIRWSEEECDAPDPECRCRRRLRRVLVATAGQMSCSKTGVGDAGAQSGPTRMLTADTDVNQLANGVVKQAASASYQKVLDGPFVLTDAHSFSSVTYLYSLPIGQDCTEPDLPSVVNLDGTNGHVIASNSTGAEILVQSARIFVNAGEELCVTFQALNAVGVLSWSGFRPY